MYLYINIFFLTRQNFQFDYWFIGLLGYFRAKRGSAIIKSWEKGQE